jgi:hypothetical protein
LVEVLVDVIHAVGIKAGGTALQTVDLVAFGKEKLG